MEEDKKPYQNVQTKKEKNSTVKITGEITADVFDAHRKRIFENVKKNFEMPGFRKGNAPEEVVKQHVHEAHILEEAANSVLNEHYGTIIKDHELDPISMPRITITKLAAGNPLGFTIEVAAKPDVKLPNVKKIAKKVFDKKEDEIQVSDEEVKKTIHDIRVMKGETIKEGEEPELTEEFVKSIGDFKTVDEFKEKVKESIKKEKETERLRAKREELAEELLKESKVEIPEFVLEDDTAFMIRKLHEYLESQKEKMEDYFKKIGKTEEEFIKEQKEHAKKQYSIRFIFEKIAEEEKIEPSEEEVKRELVQFMAYNKNITPERAEIHVREALKNEKVLQFLEDEGKKE